MGIHIVKYGYGHEDTMTANLITEHMFSQVYEHVHRRLFLTQLKL